MPSLTSRKAPPSGTGTFRIPDLFCDIDIQTILSPSKQLIQTAKMVNQIHGDSNVGKPSLYESGDQRNLPRDQRAHAEEVSKGLDVNGECSWTR